MALDVDGPLEGALIVAERCEEVDSRLADTNVRREGDLIEISFFPYLMAAVTASPARQTTLVFAYTTRKRVFDVGTSA
ncbi:hypothetical protein [Natronorubrum thiooxidans]|uniref:Uncharacterized protein n=1 Tax=Natronorubrum thiooxidans TaxID=308853 RepID=A0A1N7GMQ6_9EURY|nr:hypothetical protein [Natronorubrum thiooxidans]SIS13812.1 hypothetical protein SAMN05421752_113100 [Natronorubrum thiooxidans]